MSEKRKEDDVTKLHALEQEGLKRAEGRDAKSKSDASWFQKVQDSSNEVLRRYYDRMGDEDWDNFARILASSAYYGRRDAFSCEMSGERREDCPISRITYNHLEEMDNIYSELRDRPPPVTKKCTHFVTTLKTAETYKLNHALNDVTACLHRSIEHYEEMTKKWHKQGKCMWRE